MMHIKWLLEITARLSRPSHRRSSYWLFTSLQEQLWSVTSYVGWNVDVLVHHILLEGCHPQVNKYLSYWCFGGWPIGQLGPGKQVSLCVQFLLQLLFFSQSSIIIRHSCMIITLSHCLSFLPFNAKSKSFIEPHVEWPL